MGTAHAIAAVAAAIALPPITAGIGASGIALSAIHHLRVALQRAPSAICALEFGADGRLAIAGPDGEWREARLIAAAVPASWLATLAARASARSLHAALVVSGAVDPEPFRHLRVWLRWGSPAGRDAVQ